MSRLRRIVSFVGPSRLVLAFFVVLLILIAIAPTLFWGLDPNRIDAKSLLQSPSSAHPLGTDEVGSDVLARILHATRLNLGIAAGSVLMASIIATPAGLLAGFAGKILDEVFSAFSNAILAFPLVLFAILTVASFGPSMRTMVGVLGFVFLPRFFQVVRGQTLSLKEREFIVAARMSGASRWRILWRHILPNMAGPLAVLVPQMMAVALLAEAGLSYLGLGVQPPEVTWGTMLLNSKNYYVVAPWYALIPGLVVTAVAALFMFAGDAVSELSNPTRRQS